MGSRVIGTHNFGGMGASIVPQRNTSLFQASGMPSMMDGGNNEDTGRSGDVGRSGDMPSSNQLFNNKTNSKDGSINHNRIPNIDKKKKRVSFFVQEMMSIGNSSSNDKD